MNSNNLNNNGFNTPDGYFENLNHRILNKALFTENNGGLLVSDEYFNNLNKEIVRCTISKKPIKTIYLNVALSAAAVLIACVMLFIFVPKNSTHYADLNKLTEEQIIEHLQNDQISVELLCEAGWCNEIDLKKESNSSIENYLLNEINNDEIINEL